MIFTFSFYWMLSFFFEMDPYYINQNGSELSVLLLHAQCLSYRHELPLDTTVILFLLRKI